MQSIDKQAAKQLGAEALAALTEVAAKHGLTVTVSGGRYDPAAGTFAPKVEFAMADSGQKAFARSAAAIGLKAEDFGAEFTSHGQTFKITGVNLRAPKYPVNAEDIANGKTFKFPERTVQKALGREVTPEIPIWNA